MEIRKLSGKDLGDLQSISKSTFYTAFASENTGENMQSYMESAFSNESLAAELDNPASLFYFALLEKDIAGYLKLNTGQAQTDFRQENSLEIERIYVKEEFQGREIGKRLLEHTLSIAREKNADFVWLGVWERNPGAIRFYERNGFVKYSTHPFMLGNDRQTDIIMKLSL